MSVGIFLKKDFGFGGLIKMDLEIVDNWESLHKASV